MSSKGPTSTPSGPGTGSEGTVLIVDDDENMAALFKRYLEDKFTVLVESSGPRALQIITDDVDVVILDRQMPKLRGEEVLGILREQGYDVQVAMVSALDPDEKVMEMPFDDYLVKPVSRSELIALVETLLQRRKFHDHSTEFFRIAAKKAAIEQADVNADEYQFYIEQLAELRTELDALLEDLSPALTE